MRVIKVLTILVLMISNLLGNSMREIYLAGGCFWGVEGYFKQLDGVKNTEVGYANGDTDSTSYREISRTGHAETLHLNYDESVISLDEILRHYFRVIDPTSLNRQGGDIGTQYRVGIYTTDENSLNFAKDFIKKEQKNYNKPIVVEVMPLKNFVTAEEYHQDYLDKNPNGYCHIDLNLAKIPLKEPNLKETLSPLAYKVMKENATEPPFSSELDKHFEKGIYIDKISKKPLFSSSDKFNSGSGWPSFSKPIGEISTKTDLSHGMIRDEVRSTSSDSHLGHVFNDGPRDKGGLRYCINGVALEFVPFEKMDEMGYSEYKKFVK